MPQIIKERFDMNLRQYIWRWDDKVEFKTFQDNGLDFVMTQKVGNKNKVYHTYSDPSFNMFAAILGYRRDVLNDFPSLEEISNINSRNIGFTNHDGYKPNPFILFETGIGGLAKYEDGRIITFWNSDDDKSTLKSLGSYLGYASYSAAVSGRNFLITNDTLEDIPVGVITDGKFNEMYKVGIHMELRPEDTLNVLKSIYFFTHSKKYLDLLHESIKNKEIGKDFLNYAIRD